MTGAVLCHAFCNFMGLPDFNGISSHPTPKCKKKKKSAKIRSVELKSNLYFGYRPGDDCSFSLFWFFHICTRAQANKKSRVSRMRSPTDHQKILYTRTRTHTYIFTQIQTQPYTFYRRTIHSNHAHKLTGFAHTHLLRPETAKWFIDFHDILLIPRHLCAYSDRLPLCGWPCPLSRGF